MALLQRARQSAVKGGSGPNAGSGALGQDLQFSMGGGDAGAPAQGGNGIALPGPEGNTASGGDPAATPPSPGSAVPPGPVLSVEQSKQLITNVTALAAQGPLTPRQQADLDQAKKVVAQDTVNRLQGQSGPLSETQKQELAEAQGVLGQANGVTSQRATSAGAKQASPVYPIDHDHIIKAEFNKKGKPTGGHSLLNGDVRIVPGTERPPNAHGVYEAEVEMKKADGTWVKKLPIDQSTQSFHDIGRQIKSEQK